MADGVRLCAADDLAPGTARRFDVDRYRIALVRVGKTNFTLDAVAAAGDVRAAREVAAIVRSFGP